MIARCWALLCRLCFLLALALAGLALGVIFLRYPLIGILVLAALMWRQRKRAGSGWSHGSARWGSFADLAKGHMLGESGLFLGTAELVQQPGKWRAVLGLLSPLTRNEPACRAFLAAFFGSHWLADRLIRINNYVHIATFAKTGAGKGVALILPNLLSLLHSVVVIDLKGELWKLTAEHRRRKLHQVTKRYDPLGIAGDAHTSDTLNPLDFIDENSDDFLDDCRELAGQFVVKTGREQDEHWVDSARLVLTAFIAFVCGCEADKKRRNLNTVRLLVSSRVAFENAITVMQLQTDACQGVIARLGGMCTWYVDRELGSVLTTVQRYTEWADSPPIQRHTASSSFDPRILRTGRVSLYLCLPHTKVDTLAPLQRMWISTILRLLTKGEASEKNPVLFILDEAANMGRVEAIERAVSLLRGWGIRLWFVFQHIGQVKDVYGDRAETMLANINTQQFFSVSHYDTAEAISKRIGETTLGITTVNVSFSKSRPFGGVGSQQPGSTSTSSSTNHSDMARRVIRPEEIMVMDHDTSLLFHDNMPVIATRLIRYYDHPAFRGGRTGRQRRIGLAAGAVAACLLVLSVGFIGIAASLPQPVARRFAGQPAAMPEAWRPAPSLPVNRQRFRSPANRRQPPPRWPARPLPGGF